MKRVGMKIDAPCSILVMILSFLETDVGGRGLEEGGIVVTVEYCAFGIGLEYMRS